MKNYSTLLLSLVIIGTLQANTWQSEAQSVLHGCYQLINANQFMLGAMEPDMKRSQREFNDSFEFYVAQFKETKRSGDLKAAKLALKNIHLLQDEMLSKIRPHLSEEDFLKVQAEVHVLQYEAVRDFDIWGIKEKLGAWFAKYSTQLIKDQIQKKNPHAGEVAYVKQDSLLSPDELYYRQVRMPYVKKGLEKFFGKELPDSKLFTTGFVGTGGGYRAMILTTGYARALEKCGLLDATMYMTSLSGSTWFLAPWITGGKTVSDYQEELRLKAADEFFDIKDLSTILCTNPINLIDDLIWPKFIFGQSVSSIDLYGALLALVLFYDLADKRQEQHLSEQWDKVKDGSKPFPIYTSVSMHQMAEGYDYNWYEFNPIEVRNLDLDIYIPSWSFDSHFDCGQTLEVAPENSLGYLMGIFGSAYTVNFLDLNRIMFSEVAETPGWANPIEQIKFKVTKRLLKLMSTMPLIGSKRFSPAQVNNPFSRADDFNLPKSLTKKNELTFVDAGIDYNIPVRPLLRPQREVHAVIIGESSGNVESPHELYKFFKDAYQHYGYEYAEVMPAPSESLRFFKDAAHPEAPRLIYVNYHIDPAVIKRAQEDPELNECIVQHKLHEFDAKTCLENHCGTFNFDYSEDEFLQLAGVGEFNILAHQSEIRAFLEAECLA
jgi:hypothetical protein